MKQKILDIIKKLGGNINNVKGVSLQDDLLSITFDTVLYADLHDDFEIWGLEEFFNNNKELFLSDKDVFFKNMLNKYFCLTKEGLCQKFWKAELFTPFKNGTEDYKEWNDIFIDGDSDYGVNLTEIRKVTSDSNPDFVLMFESYGFPDHYYICLSDPCPENPTVFGTDHEAFFREISNEGSLEGFLKKFITKDKFLEIAIEDIKQFAQWDA